MTAFPRIRSSIPIVLALALIITSAMPSLASEPIELDLYESLANSYEIEEMLNPYSTVDPLYSEVLEQWKSQGASTDHTGLVKLAGSSISASSEDAAVSVGAYEGRGDVLIWQPASDEWIEYEFNIEEEGLYEIAMTYHPIMGGKHRRPVTLNVTMDGENHFIESRSIQLYRKWQDELPPRRDEYGNQIRPIGQDISDWMTVEFRDSGGSYVDSLLWFLPAGKHTLRFLNSDPVAIESIQFKAPTRMLDYKTIRGQQPDAQPVTAEPIVIEAEEADWKSDSIPLAYDNDIASTPYERGKTVYNTIDGNRWSTGNQEIHWSFEVPESGYYKIALRAHQSFSSNRSTFRSILINGRIPFEELKAYRLPYATGWQGIVLESDDQEPFEFYLEKGTNTISMRVTQEPVKPIINELNDNILILRDLVTDLKTLTGGNTDSNRTWRMEEELPGFVEQLTEVMENIERSRKQLEMINGRADGITQGLVTVVKDLQSLLSKPNQIPRKESRLVSIQGNIAEFVLELDKQSLQLDRIVIVPVEQPIPKMKASFFERLQGMIINFFYSFRPKERLSSLDEDVLNVWVLRGRDYVDLLQQLTDEMFTPQHGIKVKVNLLPDTGLLVLMNAAGKAPDVALGLPEGLPFDYALRNAMLDLSQFSDFQTLYERFAPGSWIPFYYDGSYYGVPETQSISMLFYRKDILAHLGLSVPETWEDVYDMLPVLQQNNMNMLPTTHMPFFLQNNADYYDKSGIQTALNTQKGVRAFKEWTDLYNVYAVDRQIQSFYQHFRDGTVPMGISDVSMYIQLMVAAPELNGWWGVAPIPGTLQPDGTIERWNGGGLQSSAIFSSTTKKDEAWEFLKWWTSTEVQERYGADLETINGLMFRWNTSNIEAFAQLPWKPEDLNAMLEQWRWYKEIPNVPGAYFLERELQNAWNRTVVDGMNYRSSLQQAVVDIDREIIRKMQEFDFIDSRGNVIRTLDLPTITEPWEGVNRYVRK